MTPGGSIGPLLTIKVDSGVNDLVLPLKGDLYCSESVFGIERHPRFVVQLLSPILWSTCSIIKLTALSY